MILRCRSNKRKEVLVEEVKKNIQKVKKGVHKEIQKK